ncbi:TIGR02300 family protein [Rhodospirillum sp. A1_3_36]|uniref:TIGR02300 family protein n=1 Tax=Rhodospirillum sp. A1_3_36 TaxID=3391666 RepID=UPI0039A786F9
MAKPEWGFKRTCLNCGARFYDMRRDPIVCPKCEAVFEIEAVVKPRRAPKKDTPKPTAKAVPEDDEDLDVDDDLTVDDDDEDEDLIEDTSDLGEDDDDLGEVKDHLELDNDD